MAGILDRTARVLYRYRLTSQTIGGRLGNIRLGNT